MAVYTITSVGTINQINYIPDYGADIQLIVEYTLSVSGIMQNNYIPDFGLDTDYLTLETITAATYIEAIALTIIVSNDWPSSLPENFDLGSFNEVLPNNKLRTTMDVGSPKLRRRSTAAVRPISGTMIMTATQVGVFDTFFRTTLSEGISVFTWTHPRTGATALFRFVGQPSYSSIDKDIYSVSMEMEILP